MKKIHSKTLLWLLIAAGSFLAGYWVNPKGNTGKPVAERSVLYYVDPMNPAFKSDKPGVSPSCGMPLEPVYADKVSAGGTDSLVSMPPGTIRISPEKQQLIGVKTTMVEKIPWSHSVRVLGRVTPDETRVYRVNAAVNGWIDDAFPVTTGSLVKENQLLATFYSLEYRSLLQSYFNIVNAVKSDSSLSKPGEPTARYSPAQLKQMRDTIRSLGQSTENAQTDFYRKSLSNYGMGEYQMEEMERTRKIPDVIEIRAPISGFVLSRNISPGLRFDRGVEFFRIADLSRVWITADVFENEASFFKPGLRVKMELPYQKKTLYARMSDVLPQFDPATRTLKIRLEADNAGFTMRPDMFVNVEIPVSGPAAIIVPADAVVDSGLKKTVFVDRGNGYFEPRPVETGRSLGERVEIARGLMPGEKIVVSGNFLIDSEARMQQAAEGITGKIGRDPVCGMNIDENRARAEGNFLEYRGQTYFFCDPRDREEFRKEPERYLKSSPGQKTTPVAGSKDSAAKNDPRSHEAAPRPRGAKAPHEGHEGMSMPGIPDAATKTRPKAGAAVASPPSVAPLPSLPGTEPGNMPMPGSPDGAPMPSQMPEVMFPPPPDYPVRTMPGPGEGMAMPSSPDSETLSPEPKIDRSGRMTSRPPRRRGAGPFDGTPIPGAREGSSGPRPTSSGIIPPGAGPDRSDRQTKTSGDGQNHD